MPARTTALWQHAEGAWGVVSPLRGLARNLQLSAIRTLLVVPQSISGKSILERVRVLLELEAAAASAGVAAVGRCGVSSVGEGSAVIIVSNLQLEHFKGQSSKLHCGNVFTSGVLFLFGAAGAALFPCPRRRVACNRCFLDGFGLAVLEIPL